MFEWSKTEYADPIDKDLQVSSTIASIYKIVLDWWNLEKENADKGTEYERKWLESLTNFNFSLLAEYDEEKIDATMTEMLTATEVNFVPNRIKLLASQIELRFGYSINQLMADRFADTLHTVYGLHEETASRLLTQYPYLWIVHVIQGSVLHIS